MAVSSSKLEAYIASLDEEITPDSELDMLLLLDGSLDVMKKVKASTISSGGVSGVGADGWASADSLTYLSSDSPTFLATCLGDKTAKYSPGMRFKLTQTTVKYFILTAISYSSGSGLSTFTFYGGTDYTLANAAISSPFYSSAKAPFGFPLNPDKWSVEVTDSSDQNQSSPSANTWYNLGSLSISVPIGIWSLSYWVTAEAYKSTATACEVWATLSTANNSESIAKLTSLTMVNGVTDHYSTITKTVVTDLTSKTVYYLNLKTPVSGLSSIGEINSRGPLVIRAVCAYL